MADDPILAPPSGSPAEASQPDEPLDEAYHTYEPNPVPWWVATMWAGFFLFGLVYLIRNLIPE